MDMNGPPWIEPRSAYLHIPFCGHHGGYCEFPVTAGQDQPIDLYLGHLARGVAGGGGAPAVEAGLKHIGRVSVDLIFAVPGQTLEEWDADLRAAMALGPEQISTYGLTFEKGTRLWKQQRDGAVHELGEEAEYRMYTHAMEVLEAAGYRQYEISSFAKSGGCCRH